MNKDDQKIIEETFGGTPEFVSRPSGFIIMGGQEVANTLQCSHCQKHWVVIKGSGKTRGWCLACKKPTCGKKKCLMYHAPKEAILDFQDGGGTDNHLKVMKKLASQYPGIDKLAF